MPAGGPDRTEPTLIWTPFTILRAAAAIRPAILALVCRARHHFRQRTRHVEAGRVLFGWRRAMSNNRRSVHVTPWRPGYGREADTGALNKTRCVARPVCYSIGRSAFRPVWPGPHTSREGRRFCVHPARHPERQGGQGSDDGGPCAVLDEGRGDCDARHFTARFTRSLSTASLELM